MLSESRTSGVLNCCVDPHRFRDLSLNNFSA
jgi:hypothetical protein